MKALSSAISFVVLAGALVILPGCGGEDETVPPAGGTTGQDEMIITEPGMDDTMEGPALDDDVTIDDSL